MSSWRGGVNFYCCGGETQHLIIFSLKKQQKCQCATPGNCKNENGVLSVTITLTDRATTEYSWTDLNLVSNTFPCTVWGEAAFRNTTSNPFIKICPQKQASCSRCCARWAYLFTQLYCRTTRIMYSGISFPLHEFKFIKVVKAAAIYYKWYNPATHSLFYSHTHRKHIHTPTRRSRMMSGQTLSEWGWGMVIQACLQDISCGWALGASSVLRQTNTRSSQRWKRLWNHFRQKVYPSCSYLIKQLIAAFFCCCKYLIRVQSQSEQMLFTGLVNTVVFIITTPVRVNHSLLHLSWGGSVILELVNKAWARGGWQRHTVS